MAIVVVERTINKPLDKVWKIAGDFMRSPGPSITVIPEKEGDSALLGVGSERTIKFGRTPIRERLESIYPPRCLTFSILSGAPVKSLLIKAEFMAMGEATKIKWSGTFTPKSPFISWIIAIAVRRNINLYIDELEKIK